ncbi:MAG: hypothetical protein ABWZ79_14625, partial [Pedobacter agri]
HSPYILLGFCYRKIKAQAHQIDIYKLALAIINIYFIDNYHKIFVYWQNEMVFGSIKPND